MCRVAQCAVLLRAGTCPCFAEQTVRRRGVRRAGPRQPQKAAGLALPLGPSVDELVKLVESAGAGRATAARAPQSVWEPVLARCCSAARCPLQTSPDPRRNRVGGWAKKARFACDARRGLLPCRPPDVSQLLEAPAPRPVRRQGVVAARAGTVRALLIVFGQHV